MLFQFSLWLLLSYTGDVSGEGITPVSLYKTVSEKKTSSLSCIYNGSAATDTLHWYRQYPKSRPDFLFLVNEAAFKQPANPPIPGISARLNEEKNCVYLDIINTAVSDSAVYYCWYRQYPGSRLEYLLRVLESNTVLHAQPPFPRLNASVNKVEKQVNLTISSAAVTDSALYYCALQPTYSSSKPQFLYLVSEAKLEQLADPPIPGSSAKLNGGE
ncbi:T cell receptor alpha chain MC.7.G5-like [Danio aesculapii]|uniref:T cell receptor alpha chain MC.7.G5-like n=1 Tax=Danio aesculapii TaxID=1142201 RepID=UPI0024C036FA|nr:T cell receptor alpha chain MC.7.G5-like [Danio aesculapii]